MVSAPSQAFDVKTLTPAVFENKRLATSGPINTSSMQPTMQAADSKPVACENMAIRSVASCMPTRKTEPSPGDIEIERFRCRLFLFIASFIVKIFLLQSVRASENLCYS